LRYCRGSRYAVRFATCGRACGTVPFVWPAVRGAACSAVGTACGSRRAAVGAACSAVGASCGSRRAVGRAVRLRWCGLRFAALRAVLSVRPAVRGVRLSVAVGAACGLRRAAEVGRNQAPGVYHDCRFALLFTRRSNRVHGRRCSRAKAGRGWNRAPGVYHDCRFALLFTRRSNRVHGRRCSRAKSGQWA
jgi:hypothetical protein